MQSTEGKEIRAKRTQKWFVGKRNNENTSLQRERFPYLALPWSPPSLSADNQWSSLYRTHTQHRKHRGTLTSVLTFILTPECGPRVRWKPRWKNCTFSTHGRLFRQDIDSLYCCDLAHKMSTRSVCVCVCVCVCGSWTVRQSARLRGERQPYDRNASHLVLLTLDPSLQSTTTHIYIYTHIHTYIHTYTHTHTRPWEPLSQAAGCWRRVSANEQKTRRAGFCL